MAPYSGGAHEAEVVATDGAGNTTTKHWTINVDPEGHISTAEATATMEAMEETSDSNLIGVAKEEEGIEGTQPDLGLEATESGFVATGSQAPMATGPDPGDPMIVEIPQASELYSCGPEGKEAEPEPAEEAEEQEEPEEEYDEGQEQKCVPASEAGEDLSNPTTSSIRLRNASGGGNPTLGPVRQGGAASGSVGEAAVPISATPLAQCASGASI